MQDPPKVSKKSNIYRGKPSPFKPLFGVSISKASTLDDWNRVGGGKSCITINDKSVQDLLSQRDDPTKPLFEDNMLLRVFLAEHLLADMTNTRKHNDAVNKILPYIMHQGFMLNLIGGCANFALAPHNITAPDKDTTASGQGAEIMRESDIHFISTRRGFKVIDFTTQKKCKQGNQTIEPDPGKKYVYRAETTIDVDLVSDPLGNPIFTIESNTIKYGSKKVERLLSPTNFLQKLIEYLKYIFDEEQVTVQEQVTMKIPPDNQADKLPRKNEAKEVAMDGQVIDDASPHSGAIETSLPKDTEVGDELLEDTSVSFHH